MTRLGLWALNIALNGALLVFAGCKDENPGVVAHRFVEAGFGRDDRSAALLLTQDAARVRIEATKSMSDLPAERRGRPIFHHEEVSRHLSFDAAEVAFLLRWNGSGGPDGVVGLNVMLRRASAGWRVIDFKFTSVPSVAQAGRARCATA